MEGIVADQQMQKAVAVGQQAQKECGGQAESQPPAFTADAAEKPPAKGLQGRIVIFFHGHVLLIDV